MGNSVFSTSNLSGDVLKNLSLLKATSPVDSTLDQKIKLVGDLSYFQRSLILHYKFYNEDSDSDTEDSVPLLKLNSFSYTPALYDSGPTDKNPWLTLCLNAIEAIKTHPWIFETPEKMPPLPAGLIALPADKGGAVCVFPQSFYLSKMEDMISSDPIYEKIGTSDAKKDHFTCKKVISKIENRMFLWDLLKDEEKFITHPRHKLPRLRGQPKIHKIADSLLLDKLTFRPIISGKKWPTFWSEPTTR